MDSREASVPGGNTSPLFDPRGRHRGDSLPGWRVATVHPSLLASKSPRAGCQPGDGAASLEAPWLQKHKVWGLWVPRGSCCRCFYPGVLI